MKKIKAVPHRDYPIYITKSYEGLYEAISTLIQPSSIVMITDSNVAPLYLKTVLQALEKLAPVKVYTFPAGEHSKNLITVQNIYQQLIEQKFDRSGLIVALGGGVVGDLAGFVASTYMRGVPFVQLPTTIVAQNDSSIGGKVGVDYGEHKNMIGAFYNPLLVYTNISTLDTLPQREFLGGLSEVIKHGLIQNRKLFNTLVNKTPFVLDRKQDTLLEMTYESCLVKCNVVEQDLREMGLRRKLNFGHTLGHAIESLSDFSLNHGECVAYGIVMAMYISYKRGYIDEDELDNTIACLKGYDLLKAYPGFNSKDVIEQMSYDKKKRHGKVSFVLLEAIGESLCVDDVSEEEINQALAYAEKTCS